MEKLVTDVKIWHDEEVWRMSWQDAKGKHERIIYGCSFEDEARAVKETLSYFSGCGITKENIIVLP
jgi:hypothetical protein